MSNDAVVVSESVAAPAERVYEAWTNGPLLERWLAPRAEADGRVGGRFRLEVATPEATHVVSGEYKELQPCGRIVMSWVYEGPMAPEGPLQSQVTVELRGEGGSTEIRVQHDGLTAPAYRKAIEGGAWVKALQDLEMLLTASHI